MLLVGFIYVSEAKGVAMQLYLQFGYGMMEHCRSLVSRWGDGAVILSPRDLDEKQLLRLSEDIGRSGGEVLFDPQFYVPQANHDRLVAHAFWPENYSTVGFWSGDELRQMIGELLALNRTIGCKDFILPGVYAEKVDDDWLAIQRSVREEVARHDTSGLHILATVALSGDSSRSTDEVHELLEDADEWDVDGIYLVCEHPKGAYLVDDPGWLSNVADLCAGFRLRGKRVIIGYCNHQMLLVACAGANAVASGTWMNVRSFPPGKFTKEYDDEIKQRTTWYYCPEALSEYKLPILDVAKRLGLLDKLRTPAEYSSEFADDIFVSPQPSTANFPEQHAFRHYLQCLHYQVSVARKGTFDETIDHHMKQLDETEVLLQELHANQVKGQMRDFKVCVDANRAALAVLKKERGPVLRRMWGGL